MFHHNTCNSLQFLLNASLVNETLEYKTDFFICVDLENSLMSLIHDILLFFEALELKELLIGSDQISSCDSSTRAEACNLALDGRYGS